MQLPVFYKMIATVHSRVMKWNWKANRATWWDFFWALGLVGLILDGKMYSGFNPTAGEVGHHGAGRSTVRNAVCGNRVAGKRSRAHAVPWSEAVKEGQKSAERNARNIRKPAQRRFRKAIKQE